MPAVRVGGLLTVALALLCAVGAGFLASEALVERAADPLPVNNSNEPSTVAVEMVDFGRSIPTSVLVEWSTQSFVASLPEGIVTSAPPTIFEVGDGVELMRVNDQPIYLVVSEVPAFRSVRLGDEGIDVTSIQAFLVRRGLLDGASQSGVYDDATIAAVGELFDWEPLQADSGELLLGQLIFLPEGEYSLSSPPLIGQRSDAALILDRLDPAGPTMTAVVAPQPALVAGLEVTVEDVNERLQVVQVDGPNENGEAELQLMTQTGAPPCPPNTCNLRVPPSLSTILLGRLQVVEAVTGRAVPAASIGLDEQGQAVVFDESGTPWPVTPELSQDGFVLVDESLPRDVSRVRLLTADDLVED